MKVLITGGSGFLGSALVAEFSDTTSYDLVVVGRTPAPVTSRALEYYHVGDLDGSTKWTEALQGVDVVIHTAARVHHMREDLAEAERQYTITNVEGTLNLVEQAIEAGVKRFVFVSSVKVNGEESTRIYSEIDQPAPVDFYAKSKLLAERGLVKLTEGSNMEYVILRPTLIYGPGAKANFKSLLNACYRRLPLPFRGISNRRSFLGIDNAVDLIHILVEHPAAANQIFMASDGEDLSTEELIDKLSSLLSKKPRMFPLNSVLLKVICIAAGRRNVFYRVTGSLYVSIEKAKKLLSWQPPVSLERGLKKAVDAYLHDRVSKGSNNK